MRRSSCQPFLHARYYLLPTGRTQATNARTYIYNLFCAPSRSATETESIFNAGARAKQAARPAGLELRRLTANASATKIKFELYAAGFNCARTGLDRIVIYIYTIIRRVIDVSQEFCVRPVARNYNNIFYGLGIKTDKYSTGVAIFIRVRL